MPKVCAIDDGPFDIMFRYEALEKEQGLELVVLYVGSPGLIPDIKDHVDFSDIRSFTGEIPEADLYFVDGLRGKLFDLDLPKDRTIVATDSDMLKGDARAAGYQTIDDSLITGENVLQAYRNFFQQEQPSP